MNLFYVTKLKGKFYKLSTEESRHVVKVLRLGVNDPVHLTDGMGFIYRCKIVDANPNKCKVEIRETIKKHKPRDIYIHIAIAPTKSMDRFEWFIEKVTEIGVDEITPILTDRSERKTIKNERLEKVMIAAMKQSLKAFKPKLNELTTYTDFIHNNHSATKCIAHCIPVQKAFLKNILIDQNEITVLIGPEGDFTADEIKLAVEHDYLEVSLSTSRLRTETAGIVACNTINLRDV